MQPLEYIFGHLQFAKCEALSYTMREFLNAPASTSIAASLKAPESHLSRHAARTVHRERLDRVIDLPNRARQIVTSDSYARYETLCGHDKKHV